MTWLVALALPLALLGSRGPATAMLFAGLALIGWRRHAWAPSSQHKPAR